MKRGIDWEIGGLQWNAERLYKNARFYLIRANEIEEPSHRQVMVDLAVRAQEEAGKGGAAARALYDITRECT